ncbi:MjaI family restriction endonuclease [Candidatus Desantisbacteria bacterium CG1_02_38_46]|uniref:MjaI family restriction endonuclease n=2 Tax=unclassified Candidatus Desantisiibacteriota TaxID=3106372 RepID=A0A2H9P9V2_9BACT|nr:MAG: MjaI family restriction endonuclease [Candidatus Desantisbacteria bacterium CG1_02_38_46]PIZ15101.1 MAG: MjaI family restriction endonuclease [Candidatus Desantisbacteria bacterium CG_4_10_14_0_8_um_filter_39_17]
MAKEWILNQAMNRWGLNKKNSVGPVSDLIRKCTPKTLEDWKKYYFEKVHPEEYLEELGKKLYVKITEVIQYEVAEVTEKDCIDYIKDVVISRTFDGYQTEIQTIYGQLQKFLGVPIKPAPDEWDRLYNVDFFIEVKDKYIGLQIKPVTFEHTFEDYKWKEMQETTHKKFQQKFGGRVFTIFSVKEDDKKKIKDPEVIDEIKKEIKRLEKM